MDDMDTMDKMDKIPKKRAVPLRGQKRKEASMNIDVTTKQKSSSMSSTQTDLPSIQSKIYILRNQQVMFDFDLAKLYGVETKRLKQAVKRNIHRFPPDFMFTVTSDELKNLRSQIVTSSWGGTRYAPFAFTEQGVAMHSSVLNSKIAIEINIAIIRAFVFIRQYALSHRDLTEKLKELERKYDQKFHTIHQALDYLLQKDRQQMDAPKRKRIGFNAE